MALLKMTLKLGWWKFVRLTKSFLKTHHSMERKWLLWINV